MHEWLLKLLGGFIQFTRVDVYCSECGGFMYSYNVDDGWDGVTTAQSTHDWCGPE